MTNREINQIKSLQLQGFGYRKIATKMGIPINTVKSYCKRHPIKSEDSIVSSDWLCAYCGATLTKTRNGRQKKFCSDKCRMAWWNSHRDEIRPQTFHTFICENCGESFTRYGRKAQRFCSRTCFADFRRKAVAE